MILSLTFKISLSSEFFSHKAESLLYPLLIFSSSKKSTFFSIESILFCKSSFSNCFDLRLALLTPLNSTFLNSSVLKYFLLFWLISLFQGLISSSVGDSIISFPSIPRTMSVFFPQAYTIPKEFTANEEFDKVEIFIMLLRETLEGSWSLFPSCP